MGKRERLDGRIEELRLISVLLIGIGFYFAFAGVSLLHNFPYFFVKQSVPLLYFCVALFNEPVLPASMGIARKLFVVWGRKAPTLRYFRDVISIVGLVDPELGLGSERVGDIPFAAAIYSHYKYICIIKI